MEKLSDFFKDIKDRLTNPLISSFLISWIVANWQIVIGLFFYKIGDLKLDGYHSYSDLIRKNINLTHNLIWPLLVSLLYTFVFPFIRNVIFAFGAWIRKWGRAWTLNISKNGVISINNYVRLREQYQQLIKNLEEISNAESETQNENSILNLENIELKKNNASLKALIDKININNSFEILAGNWKYRAFPQNGNPVEDEFNLGDTMLINGSSIVVYKNNKQNQAYNIENIVCSSSTLILLLTATPSNGKWAVWRFNIDSNLNYLSGMDNNQSSIKMERINKRESV